MNIRKASHVMLLRKQPNDTLAIDRLQKAETHSSWLGQGSV